jgi:hypothetical protein
MWTKEQMGNNNGGCTLFLSKKCFIIALEGLLGIGSNVFL